MVSVVAKPGTPDEKKEIEMRRRMTWLVLLSAAMVVGRLLRRKVWATPANFCFKATTNATCIVDEFVVFN